MRFRANCISLGLAAITLSGCAVAYTDETGAQHVFGLVDLVVQPADRATAAGDIVEITTFGLSYLGFQDRAAVGIGYQRITSVAFRDNTLAIGPFDRVPATASTAPRN